MRGINIQKYSNVFWEERVFSHIGCLPLSGFDKISEDVFEGGTSLTEKAEQEKNGRRMYTHPCYAYLVVSY